MAFTNDYRVIFKPGIFASKNTIQVSAGFDFEKAVSSLLVAKGLATNPSGDCCTLVVGGDQFKVYSALISQSGVGIPTATVLENTLGVIPVFSVVSTGVYALTSVGAFPETRTAVISGKQIFSESDTFVNTYRNTDDNIQINSYYYEFSTNPGTAPVVSDGVLSNYYLEIRVYP